MQNHFILISKLSKTKLTHRRTFDISGRVIIGNIVRGEMEVKMKSQSALFCNILHLTSYFCIGRWILTSNIGSMINHEQNMFKVTQLAPPITLIIELKYNQEILHSIWVSGVFFKLVLRNKIIGCKYVFTFSNIT